MSGRRLIRRGIGMAAAVTVVAVGAAVVPFPGTHTDRASSAPIEGDPGFNGGATLTVPFATTLTTSGDAVAPAPGGGAYVAGRTDAGGGNIFVSHLLANGALDPSFGNAGITTIDLGGTADRVGDLVVEPSGSLLIAGSRTGTGGSDVVLLRVSAGGVRDTGYGSGGVAVVDLGSNEQAHSVVVDSAGRAVVLLTSGPNVAIARLSSAGALDPGFDGDGLAPPPLGSPSTEAGALAVSSDGGVYVAGSAPASVFDGPPNTAMAVGRLTSAGAVDTNFGLGGVTHADEFTARSGTGSAVAVRSDGSLWLAGANGGQFGSPSQPALVTVAASGTINGFVGQQASFGDLGGGSVEAVFATPSGAIVAVHTATGYSFYARGTGGDSIFGYGSSGLAVVDVGTGHAVAGAADGGVFVAGTDSGAALVTHLTPGGQPDAAFGSTGTATVAVRTPRSATAAAVTVNAVGKVLVAANLGGTAGGVGLVQVNGDGTADAGFGVGGMAIVPSFSTWVPFNGNLVSRLINLIGGYTLLGAGPELVRISPFGDVDPSFGRFGRFVVCNECRVTDAALEQDQRVVAVGRTNSGLVTVARSTGDGVADETLNRNGFVELPATYGGDAKVAALADRRIVVAGPTGADSANVTVLRLTATGTIDTSFGGDAGVTGALSLPGAKQVLGVVANPDGSVLVVVRAGTKLALARFTDAGMADAAFGAPTNHGIVAYDVPGLVGGGSVAVNGAGKVFVAGTLERNGSRDGVVFRFASNGANETAAAIGGPGSFDLTATDSAAAVTVGTNGEPVLAGTTPAGANNALAVRRFRTGANGTPPTTVPTTSTTVAPQPLPSFAGRFHAVSPARVLDTRVGIGVQKARVGPAGMLDLAATGRGGVPATGVASVALSVVAVSPSAPTYVTVYPAGEATPVASNLNVSTGGVVNNMVVAKLGVGGGVRFFNAAGSVDLVADVVGWFDDGTRNDGAQFTALNPARVLDTRTGVGAGAGPVHASSLVDLTVTGAGGVPPTGVSAVVLNVAATGPTAATFITAFPTGEALPATSNVNVAAGETVSKLVVAKLGTGGKVSLFNSDGDVQLIADVVGWFDVGAPSPTKAFTGLTPARLLDTRSGLGVAAAGPVGAGKQVLLDVAGKAGVPSGAKAVVLNVTATDASAASYLTVYPATDPLPFAASLNVPVASTVSNLVVAKLGTDGKVRIYNAAGRTSVIADVVGWFS